MGLKGSNATGVSEMQLTELNSAVCSYNWRFDSFDRNIAESGENCLTELNLAVYHYNWHILSIWQNYCRIGGLSTSYVL
jgi:hypothetical protein